MFSVHLRYVIGKLIKTLGCIFVFPINIQLFKKKQHIYTYNKIVTHWFLYIEYILEKMLLRKFDNVIEVGLFVRLCVCSR